MIKKKFSCLIILLFFSCTQTIDPFATKNEKDFLATGLSSDIVQFGGGVYCYWSIQHTNIRIKIQLNRSKILNASILNSAIELPIQPVNCESNGISEEEYILKTAQVNESSVEIHFTPSETNLTKCNALFTGVMVEDKIYGNIQWSRFDQSGDLNYIINVPVTLERYI